MTLYKLIDHTADLGIEITGRTKKELFTKALWSLMDILIVREAPLKSAKSRKQKSLTVEGSDVADLLINFLREILYLVNGKAFIIGTCEITECGSKKLATRLWLEPYNRKKHAIKTEVKAVTYHGLNVEKTKSGWKARVIFDV